MRTFALIQIANLTAKRAGRLQSSFSSSAPPSVVGPVSSFVLLSVGRSRWNFLSDLGERGWLAFFFLVCVGEG